MKKREKAEKEREKKMKKRKFGTFIVCLLVACCCYTHRRVIRALIMGEPMPKAPNWHCWVPKEYRRG